MHKTNWQNGEHVPRKHMLIKFIHLTCKELGVVYWRPRQQASILQYNPEHDQPPPSYPADGQPEKRQRKSNSSKKGKEKRNSRDGSTWTGRRSGKKSPPVSSVTFSTKDDFTIAQAPGSDGGVSPPRPMVAGPRQNGHGNREERKSADEKPTAISPSALV